jgi:hypothetical protein
MNLEPENRRSFVKKSLATSMTLTFAGLIRAHGDGETGGTTIDPENTYVTTNSGTTTTFDLEGTYYTTIGNTTTFDLEETYETTTYEETTTWDPEETTIVTTIDQTVSLVKHLPEGCDSATPGKRKLIGVNPDAGALQIQIDNAIVFQVQLGWFVEFEEDISFDADQKYVSTDCVQYFVKSKVLFEHNPLNLFGGPLDPMEIGVLVDAINSGIAAALDMDIDPLKPPGPRIWTAYSVTAGWGIDINNTTSLGPIVVVSDRLGSSQISSHGYWARVESEVSANPSKSVNFRWTLKVDRSNHIKIEKQIKFEILQRIVPLAQQLQQAIAPLASWKVLCEILPPPDIEIPHPLEQLVVAYEEPPVAAGLSCEYLGINGECHEPAAEEQEPTNPHWKKDDPNYPQTEFGETV